MQKSAIPVFVLLLATAAVLIYMARPTETAQQYAQRKCTEAPRSGITFDKCIDDHLIRYHAGRKDDER